MYSDPDPNDPYTFNGISQAPEYYDRVFNTPDDVRRHIAQAQVTRRMTDEDVIAKTGLSSKAFLALKRHGTGRLRDFLAVLEVLGVRAVTVPASILLGT